MNVLAKAGVEITEDGVRLTRKGLELALNSPVQGANRQHQSEGPIFARRGICATNNASEWLIR